MRSSILLFSLLITVIADASPRSVQVYAHRGARSFAPENTMPAYRTTLRIGADWVDMDVVLTKDGQVLISHDPVLNPAIVRDADGKFLSPRDRADAVQKYAVKNLTLAQTQMFD